MLPQQQGHLYPSATLLQAFNFCLLICPSLLVPAPRVTDSSSHALPAESFLCLAFCFPPPCDLCWVCLCPQHMQNSLPSHQEVSLGFSQALVLHLPTLLTHCWPERVVRQVDSQWWCLGIFLNVPTSVTHGSKRPCPCGGPDFCPLSSCLFGSWDLYSFETLLEIREEEIPKEFEDKTLATLHGHCPLCPVLMLSQ